jgi:hypothetical protein
MGARRRKLSIQAKVINSPCTGRPGGLEGKFLRRGSAVTLAKPGYFRAFLFTSATAKAVTNNSETNRMPYKISGNAEDSGTSKKTSQKITTAVKTRKKRKEIALPISHTPR